MEKVAIVGAGLVGSLLSVFLSKRGFQVDVYERRSDPRAQGFIGGRSINLALSDRGWKALDAVGLSDIIRPIALPMEGRMIHDVAGNTNFQPYGRKGQAIYSVSRGQLNMELINATEPDENVRYHFDMNCHRVDIDQTELHFKTAEGTHTASPDLIMGTDGAFSRVRLQLQKSGRFNFSQHYLDSGYKEIEIPANEDGTHKLDSNALHIWPRGKFMLIALPNLDGSFTCTLFLDYEGDVSFQNLDTDTAIMEFFEKYFADIIPLVPDLLKEYHDNPTSSLVTIKCAPWAKNRVQLLGDASHAIVPFYGQGMNSGFEDCTLMAEAIDQKDGEWEDVLKKFSVQRKKDADAISELALRNYIEMRDLVADENFLLRKKIEKKLYELWDEEYIPLYSMVTFSHMPYAQALDLGRRQDALFKEILMIEDLEEKWDSGSLDHLLEGWLERFKNRA